MSHASSDSTTPRKKGKHLSASERVTLQTLVRNKLPVNQIAGMLGVHRSTIYRELQRGRVINYDTQLREYVTYSSDRGIDQHAINASNKGPGLKLGHCYRVVEALMRLIAHERYSPYAAWKWCREHEAELGEQVAFSPRTLYNYIKEGLIVPQNALPGKRRKKAKEKRQKRAAYNNPLAVSIEKRPEEVNKREVFGHWEGDTVVGKQGTKACLFVLTERMSRYQIILKIKDKTTASVVKALNKLERKLGKARFAMIFKSITFDNGCEFMDVDGMAHSSYKGKAIRTQVYFAHAYCSSERGSNENANRLIRRFLPKGVDMTQVTQKQCSRISHWMNAYPRKLHEGKSAGQIFRSLLKAQGAA